MVKLLHFLSIYVFPLFILIPIIKGIIKYKYLTLPLKLIFYLMLVYAVITCIESVRLAYHLPSTMYADVETLIDFPIISYFYILILNRKWKMPLIVITIVYVVFWVADLFFEAKSPTYVYPIIYESIFIMLYAMVYMHQQTQANIEKRWGDNSYNWVNSGFFIYVASTLLMFTFYNLMLKMQLNNLFLVFWIISDIALTLEFILIGIGFSKCKQ